MLLVVSFRAGALVEGCEHPVPQLEGDFSLNAANAISADLLLRAGLRWVGGAAMGMDGRALMFTTMHE